MFCVSWQSLKATRNSINLLFHKFSRLKITISHAKIRVFRYGFRLPDFVRRLSGLGWIYNLHFRAFQTFSFRAKKKLEIRKMFLNTLTNFKKKCSHNCTRNLDLVRKIRKWICTSIFLSEPQTNLNHRHSNKQSTKSLDHRAYK